MECYCDYSEISVVRKIQFSRMRLIKPARIYWTLIKTIRERQHKNLVESWEKMKDKLKEKYLLEFYMDHLLDKLHNLCRDNMSVRDYIARVDYLTLCCDMRDDCYQIISKFCSG